MTFEKIITIEPRISKILKEAGHTRSADWDDYTIYKQQLSALVGFGAAEKNLRTCNAYEITIIKLCDALKI
jgi:predicted MPP superfamily phosphohydrolase